MKLVFDDGSEQEIAQEDFYCIIVRAGAIANKNKHRWLDTSDKYLQNGSDDLALMYMRWADREARVNNICTTLESLYF